MQWIAGEKATKEMILAQNEGAAAVMKCLKKYREKKLYTRNDIIHSYYKLVGVRQKTSTYTDEIYYEWDSIELMEQTVGESPAMSPQNQIQYDNDLRSIGAINGILGHIVSLNNGGGLALHPPR